MSSRYPSLLFLLTLLLGAPATAEPLDFNLDVRPLLSDRCFKCHGFDKNTRESDLRLDIPEGAFAQRDGSQAIVPGKPEESLVWQRITSTDPDDVMPPPESHLKLNEKEKELIRRWITEGAEYKEHWALIAPQRPDIPQPTNATVQNPIDAFIAHRLLRDGLKQSPAADERTLIRRLSLDLRGLPPTPEEVTAFLNDNAPDAYEKLVDRFLADPSYGERMAWPWLNAARYADSNGYQGDGERTMWPWRDWVVDAFNRNIPWDDLTIWQLAGDLLPNATTEQRLATGFLRNHPINGEGGRIPEENRVDYVMDMTETTGTVWLALTFNCCRCHDHKYDAITQEEYYKLSAFFNQTPVNGSGRDPRTPPVISIATGERKAEETALLEEISALREDFASFEKDLTTKQPAWEKSRRTGNSELEWAALSINSAKAEKQKLEVLEDGSILATGENPNNDVYNLSTETNLKSIASIRLEAIRHESMTNGYLSRSDSGNFVLTDFRMRVQPLGGNPIHSKFKSAIATYEQGDHQIAKTYDGKANTGWAVYENNQINRDHEAIFHLDKPIEVPEHASIIITMRHDSQHANHNLGRFRLSVSATADAKLSTGERRLQDALAVEPGNRSEAESNLLATAHRESVPRHAELKKLISDKENELNSSRRNLPKVMVMEDMDKQRKTYILDVGVYDKRGKEVGTGTPAALPSFSKDLPQNRLGLAQWLTDGENPLTARVTVNRFWQQLFGVGLIKSPENFGVQSEVPIHPRLLDYLAVEFQESGWDVKQLIRILVNSHTYRQSSRVSAELLEADPANRLLARGARYRMPAWMIRDQALSASGLLVDKKGGAPVNSYQPEGIWAEATFGKKRYSRGKGDDLYRRSIYSFWRRIAAPPMFFDNPGRETCSVTISLTNTPLHALSTLNDTTYVEAARALADRAAASAGESSKPAAQIAQAFQLVVARNPSAQEQEILENIYSRAQVRFTSDPGAAANFLKNGESPRKSELPEPQHAALATVCLGILNLDEALTKE
ncbi:MAG: PSD1 and planctomycete cytochrome C domain-containing protein [Roseibacillus sp.]|nr:PSD1 and planctomycete cytochrome C domain-containing protein [Roseibacillus sp.]